jgi:hypothetical protein
MKLHYGCNAISVTRGYPAMSRWRGVQKIQEKTGSSALYESVSSYQI